MAAQAKDRVSLRIQPPLLYAVPLVIGVLLRVVFPMELLPTGTALIVGGSIAVLSFALGLPAFLTMRQARTSVNPNQPTTAIVTQGPFRLTRNPIYLSLTVLYAGLALMANAWWALVLLPVVVVLVHFLVILPEEQYLEQKFGEPYRSYKANVRRWI
jgi:protein-S-isoprenylcysteine O-methyltransferase Ste14